MCQKFHRHSIFCILPPHILREIAKNSDDKKQREQALNTLGLDATSRTNRINEQFMAMNVARPLMTATPTAQRSMSISTERPTGLPAARPTTQR